MLGTAGMIQKQPEEKLREKDINALLFCGGGLLLQEIIATISKKGPLARKHNSSFDIVYKLVKPRKYLEEKHNIRQMNKGNGYYIYIYIYIYIWNLGNILKKNTT